MVEGDIAFNDKVVKKYPDAGQANMVHKLAIGEWVLKTPVLNLNDDGSLFLLVPYEKPAVRCKNVAKLNRSRILEVCF